MEGIGVFEIAEEAIRMHKAAFGDDPVLETMLDAGGEYAWRARGEDHMWTPDAIAKLQHSTRANNWNTYKEYAQIINDQSKRHMTLRGLFEFKIDPSKAIRLTKSSPPRKSSSALPPVPCRWAPSRPKPTPRWPWRMNRIGGKSNTGEGGEDERRYRNELKGIPDQEGRHAQRA